MCYMIISSSEILLEVRENHMMPPPPPHTHTHPYLKYTGDYLLLSVRFTILAATTRTTATSTTTTSQGTTTTSAPQPGFNPFPGFFGTGVSHIGQPASTTAPPGGEPPFLAQIRNMVQQGMVSRVTLTHFPLATQVFY